MINIKNFVLGITIFLLTLSVGIYGINTLYGSGPKYEDYCSTRQIFTQEDCIKENGTWMQYPQETINAKPVPVGQQGYCDIYTVCQPKFEEAEKKYSRNVFFIALPLGIIVIAIGGLVFGLEFVGAGLMFGGVGIIFYGVVQFWRYADDWLKFVLSLIGLIIVVGLAYYINKNLGQKIFKKK